eukprot:g860.t1
MNELALRQSYDALIRKTGGLKKINLRLKKQKQHPDNWVFVNITSNKKTTLRRLLNRYRILIGDVHTTTRLRASTKRPLNTRNIRMKKRPRKQKEVTPTLELSCSRPRRKKWPGLATHLLQRLERSYGNDGLHGDEDIDADLMREMVVDGECSDSPDGSVVDGDSVDDSVVDGDSGDGSVVDGDSGDGSVVDGDSGDGSVVDGDSPDGSVVDVQENIDGEFNHSDDGLFPSLSRSLQSMKACIEKVRKETITATKSAVRETVRAGMHWIVTKARFTHSLKNDRKFIAQVLADEHSDDTTTSSTAPERRLAHQEPRTGARKHYWDSKRKTFPERGLLNAHTKLRRDSIRGGYRRALRTLRRYRQTSIQERGEAPRELLYELALKASTKHGAMKAADEVIKMMEEDGVAMNRQRRRVLMKGCIETQDLDRAMELLRDTEIKGIEAAKEPLKGLPPLPPPDTPLGKQKRRGKPKKRRRPPPAEGGLAIEDINLALGCCANGKNPATVVELLKEVEDKKIGFHDHLWVHAH